MKVTLIAVQSLDGKITKWDDVQDVSTWTSKEDQEFFLSMIQSHKILIMGSSTYEAAKEKIKKEKERKRIVMTSRPDEYKNEKIEGRLEFTSESPEELIKRLEKEGGSEILLVGGSAIYTAFLKANLVTDLYITIEPKIFGKGKMLAENENLDIKLKLNNIKQLNLQGTILQHLEVLPEKK